MSKAIMSITFKLKENVSSAEFLQASDKIQEDYVCKCKGYVSRKLYVQGDIWTDVIIWETMNDAESSMGESEQNPSAVNFLALIGEMIQYVVAPLERNYE